MATPANLPTRWNTILLRRRPADAIAVSSGYSAGRIPRTFLSKSLVKEAAKTGTPLRVGMAWEKRKLPPGLAQKLTEYLTFPRPRQSPS